MLFSWSPAVVGGQEGYIRPVDDLAGIQVDPSGRSSQDAIGLAAPAGSSARTRGPEQSICRQAHVLFDQETFSLLSSCLRRPAWPAGGTRSIANFFMYEICEVFSCVGVQGRSQRELMSRSHLGF
jgi:hypothetical protein